MNKKTVDLILSGRYLLILDKKDTIVEQGALAINDGVIVARGKTEEIGATYRARHIIAEEHGLIMPGLVNTHTHAAMSCFRGLADDLPLMQWLQEYIFPVEATLSGDMVYSATLLSLCEMIKSGTTSFCDMYLFAADVCRAVEQSGMRAWVGEVLYDFPSPNYGELANGFAYTQELLAQYRNHDLIRITIDPHAVYTCSPELLVRLGNMARDNDLLYHVHLAENSDEVNTCKERYGCSPVQHLEKLGLLDEHVVAAHCVMVTDDEIELMAERGVKVAHCPESNLKLASGVAPVPKLIDQGVTVGIGTDGAASNNDVDMFGEMNTAAKVHKVTSMDPTTMDAVSTLRAGTMGGAAVLGADKVIGSLEVGKKADCIVIDLDQPHLTPLYNPVSHLVYAARGGDVIHSVINGRVVMEDRQLLTLDENAIIRKIQEMALGISKQRNVG
ncbi:amidohydrolase family protein [Desulfogranum marinum]|uniref:amidohydrolase family protein n=1 Tax=Desulfogranum marinum TaxID=453220 RepID=UPI0019633A96|nr:amidohydrolase [Desulfogranum marinum]MBM9511327.1 amidohydrolase [Desulfogranum marinum]